MEMRAEVMAVAAGVVEEVDRWREAYEGWQAALAQRKLLDDRSRRRLLAATGGLGLRRFQTAYRCRRILTVADATLRARAVRGRPAVDATVAEGERVMAEADAAVADAMAVLAERSRQVLSRGRLGAALTGLSAAELAHLARPVRQ